MTKYRMTPCPYRWGTSFHHRWRLEIRAFTSEGPVWDRRCSRCGKWYDEARERVQ